MPAYAPILSLAVFVVAYFLFAIFPTWRSRVAMAGAAILIFTGSLVPPPSGAPDTRVEGGASTPGAIVPGEPRPTTTDDAPGTPAIGLPHGGPASAAPAAQVPLRDARFPARVLISVREAFTRLVSWNIMGLFFGTLLLAELFLLSRAPSVIAEAMIAHLSSARGAMIALCGLAGFISMFVENVAVVLLLAPIAFSLAEKLKTSPVALLIGVAISSNLQGTATMIGDPPSMILAGYMKMGFFDFFVYHGRPGIFFAVQVGAIASAVVLAWIFRRHRGRIHITDVETARSWVPAAFLVVLIAGLSLSSVVDPDFTWYAGTLTMLLATLAFAWHALAARWNSPRELVRCLDWDTTFFLIGVFILVGGLSESGWLERLADVIAGRMGGNLVATFVLIIALSVLISGFVDNVPFLLAMIPVVQSVAAKIGAQAGGMDPLPLLLFGMLVGACLGGNITPIGASANVVTLGLLRRRGYVVSFRSFMALSVPFTVVAVLASSVFIWLVWGR
jgi:Na+/H+ antiporter NhaD/arsenite permease-like protein